MIAFLFFTSWCLNWFIHFRLVDKGKIYAVIFSSILPLLQNVTCFILFVFLCPAGGEGSWMARISSQHAQLVGARPAELGRVCRLCTQVSLRGCFRSVSLTLFSFLPCSCLFFLYLLECLTKSRTFVIPNVIAPRVLPQYVLTNVRLFVPNSLSVLSLQVRYSIWLLLF